MSTDHYNIDGPRSSSRVLRPPGGSYTDILGVKAEDDSSRPSKCSQKSAIADCLQFSEHMQEQTIKKDQQQTIKKDQQQTIKKDQQQENEKEPLHENGNENCKPKANEDSNNEKNETNASQRVRVPPGGWSSGLW